MAYCSDHQFMLSDYTWTKSSSGMYYCEDIAPSNFSCSTILGITLIGFGSLNNTHIITPMISSDGKKVRFISNVDTFNSSEYIKVRIVYRK